MGNGLAGFGAEQPVMASKALALAALCLLAVSSVAARDLINPGRQLKQRVGFGENVLCISIVPMAKAVICTHAMYCHSVRYA